MNCRLLPVVVVLSFAGVVPAADPAEHWPSFRGPNATGVVDGAALPTEFNVPAGDGVLWQTPIPGLGLSSPVVWADRIFVTTAISQNGEEGLRVGLYGDISPVEDDAEYTWRLYAIDRQTGEVLWHRDAHHGQPAIKRHPKASHANPTPATDGERVVAFFGSEGLHCYDMEGEHLWSVDLGVLDAGYFQVPEAQWGFASSPILHEGKVIVQADVQGESFIAAFDAADGSELWRTPRDEVPTWSTPTIAEHDGRTQVVANGWRHIGGYDFETGEPIWWLEGGGDIPVPTPVVAHGQAYIANAHGRESPLYAIDLAATGDITPPRGQTESDGVTWAELRNGAYMQTPIVVGELIYSARDNGVLSCYDARTGEVVYRERIGRGGTGFTASPVATAEHLYFASEDGQVYVVATGRQFKVVAESEAGAVVMATPAISGDTLILRTTQGLVAIGE